MSLDRNVGTLPEQIVYQAYQEAIQCSRSHSNDPKTASLAGADALVVVLMRGQTRGPC